MAGDPRLATHAHHCTLMTDGTPTWERSVRPTTTARPQDTRRTTPRAELCGWPLASDARSLTRGHHCILMTDDTPTWDQCVRPTTTAQAQDTPIHDAPQNHFGGQWLLCPIGDAWPPLHFDDERHIDFGHCIRPARRRRSPIHLRRLFAVRSSDRTCIRRASSPSMFSFPNFRAA